MNIKKALKLKMNIIHVKRVIGHHSSGLGSKRSMNNEEYATTFRFRVQKKTKHKYTCS